MSAVITTPTLSIPSVAPEPHPFIYGPTLFLGSIPSDLSPQTVIETLSKYGSFSSTMHQQVPQDQRFLPNPFYDGMTYSMPTTFEVKPAMERALALFPSEAVAQRGIVLSLFPTLEPIPAAHPDTVACQLSLRSFWDGLPHPTPELVFDTVRPWGSLRSVNLTRSGCSWTARLQFWRREDVQRFSREFPKEEFGGWDTKVFFEEQPQLPSQLVKFPPPGLPPPGFSFPVSAPFHGLAPFTANLPAPPFANYMPDHYAQAYPHGAAVAGFRRRAFSMEPSQMMIPIIPDPRPHTLPIRTVPLPPVTPRMSRPASIWREYQDYDEKDGSYKTMGLKDQYENKLPHKKGQHIRKLEAKDHPSGKEGYIDYCNLRIKGFGPDVNDVWLKEICQKYEGFVGSRVTRHPDGRPTDFAFANFETQSQTRAALDDLNGMKCGAKKLAVAFHQPTTLKPDKVNKLINGPG